MKVLKSVLAVSCIGFLACGEDNPSSTLGNVAASNNTDQSGQEILSSDAMEMSSSDESAVVLSSSSLAVKESSSSFVVPGCKTETEDNCVYGTIIDSRDGKTYKTVVIGDQEWMAENLQYDYPVDIGDSVVNYCNAGIHGRCSDAGVYYTWADAVGADPASNCNENKCELPEGDIQGICPDGWHLPSVDEFKTLFFAIGGNCGSVSYTSQHEPIQTCYNVSNKLKTTSGWKEMDSFDGDDRYGFSAIPSGRWASYGMRQNSFYAVYNTSTQYNDRGAYTVWLYGGTTVGLATGETTANIHTDFSKGDRYVVRCVKNVGI